MSYAENFNKAMSSGQNIQWYRPPELVAANQELEKQWEQDAAMGEQAYYARGAEEGDPFAKKALGMLNEHLGR